MEIEGKSTADMGEQRDRWSSRTAFIFAAVGSAVGIGNLWRFPWLSYKYGGGAFFLPYLLSLFLLGIPILTLELGVGQTYQGGHVKAFNALNHRLRGIGFGATWLGYMCATYYSVILCWALTYFFNSFSANLPWRPTAEQIATCKEAETAGTPDAIKIACNAITYCNFHTKTFKCPVDEFYVASQTFVQWTGSSYADTAGVFLSYFTNIAILSIVWIFVFLSISWGARILGYVVYATMALPIILLLVILIRGSTLPGASAGIYKYIGEWDMSVLVRKPDIWSNAAGQIFFSIGICFGMMSAYASFNKKGQNFAQDTLIISLTNSSVSIMAGFAVFSIAGYLAHQSDVPLEDLKTASFGVAFVTFPVAFAHFGTPGAQIFSALFFLMFFLLGIDSAFSMVEGGLTTLVDSRTFKRVPKYILAGVMCTIGFLLGFPYLTNKGMHLLDVADFYLLQFGGVFIGLSESLAAAWLYGAPRQIEELGSLAVCTFDGIFAVAVSILFGILFGAPGVKWATGVAVTLCVLLLILAVVLSMFFAQRHQTKKGVQTMWTSNLYWLTIGNVEELRKELNKEIEDVTLCCIKWPAICSQVTILWSVLMKYLVPLALIALLSQQFAEGQFGFYGGYPLSIQSIGLVFSLIGVALVFIAFAAPQLFDFAMANPTESCGESTKSTSSVDA